MSQGIFDWIYACLCKSSLCCILKVKYCKFCVLVYSGGTKCRVVRTQGHCCLDTHVPFFFPKSNAKHLCQILSGIWFVTIFFLAETNTRTWVGHQHPHQCLCNTGQDCSIAILLGTPPLGTQQLLVNTIWQSTKEQKTKGPGLQRTWLASLHKSRFPDAVSTHICCDLCANQLCWANSGSVHFFTIQFCSIFS